MNSAGETVDSAALLCQLDEVADQLMAVSHAAASDESLLANWPALERVRRKLAAAEHALVAEIDARGVAQSRSVKNTASLGRQLLRIAPGDASARVRAARNCGPRTTLTGQCIEAKFPQVAAAMRTGALSDRHAHVITRCIDALPDQVREEAWDEVESTLVGYAHDFDPALLAKLAQRVTDCYDPDGKLRDFAYRDRTREFGLCVNADGSSTPTGSFTAELTEHLLVVLDALAGPKPADEGARDPRSPAQRNHDALLQAMKTAVSSGLVPNAAGLTSMIILTFDHEAWATGEGFAKTSHGTLIPASEGIEWAGGNPRAIGVVLNSMKAITAYSSVHRIFTEQQRLAMLARDGGFCTAPQCDAPPGHAEAHHVTDFAITGRTSVDDGAWACCVEHRELINQGWTTQMIDGRPHWIPPGWLDPERRPRRNSWNDI